MSEPQDSNRANFAIMAAALKRAGLAWPVMVIDRPRLEANIDIVREALENSGLALRLAAKSLQSPDLLRLVMARAGTERLMVFNGAMLTQAPAFAPEADILLGRPLPAAEAAQAMGVADPQWLIDTPGRLAQYLALARARHEPMRVNFEIDVGLRRGGFADPAALGAAIDTCLAEPLVRITGLMGYDAHAAGALDPAASAARAQARYAAFLEVLSAKTGLPPDEFTLNTAGSLTWRLHLAAGTANEVSIGSAFVKAANYDAPTLSDIFPACFIAEPVLKRVEQPGGAPGFFLYGGYGDADPVWPPGLGWSRHFGGRGMLMGDAAIGADDFVFLRPRESEGALTYFGDIAVFDGAEISETWPAFPPAG